MTNTLQEFSNGLADAVQKAASSTVRVDDGSRLTATGIVWSSDGIIVSSSHGTESDEDVFIVDGEGGRYSASVIGRDHETDIAVLKTEARLTPIERTSPEEIRLGNIVLALGMPGESGLRVSFGVVGGLIQLEAGGNLIHTDAPMYPGFSGGPLVDANGRLVGMNNLGFGRGRGLSIATSVLAASTDSIIKHGKVQRAYLGVRTQPAELPEALKSRLGISQSLGLLVLHVDEGSAAEVGGLLMGDILIRVADSAIEDPKTLRYRLLSFGAGTPVQIEILRGGELKSFTVTLGSSDSQGTGRHERHGRGGRHERRRR